MEHTINPTAERDKSTIILPDGNLASQKESKKSSLNLPEAYKLLAITAFGYCCAYVYEMGFCKNYGIPVDLIRLESPTLLFCGVIAFSLIILLYQFGFILFTVKQIFHGKGKTPVRDWFFSFAPLIFLVLLIGYFEDFRGFSFFFPLWMVLLRVFNVHGLPLLDWLKNKRAKSYGHYFQDWNGPNIETRDPNDAFFSHLEKRGVANLVMALIVGNFILYLSFNIGKSTGKNTETFLYRSSPRTEVVLRVYGTTAITARVDDKGKVYPELRILKMDEQTNEFVLTKTGKLTPVIPSQETAPAFPVQTLVTIKHSPSTNAPSTNIHTSSP